MKITLGALMAAREPLKTLLNCALPIVPAYKLSKLIKEVDCDFVNFEERRMELVKEFGEEKDGVTTVKSEYIEVFVKQMTELNAVEVDLKYEPVSVESLGESVVMKPVDMLLLEPFLS